MKQLNIFELQTSINKKKQNRISVYEEVLGKCHAKIQVAAHKEFYECIYDVPNYVVGLPLYNITECINHLIEQLKHNGFSVTYFFPKTLYISWRPKSALAIEHTNTDLPTRNAPGAGPHRQPRPETLTDISKIQSNYQEPDDSMLLNYIPYKNDKGKFVLNVD